MHYNIDNLLPRKVFLHIRQSEKLAKSLTKTSKETEDFTKMYEIKNNIVRQSLSSNIFTGSWMFGIYLEFPIFDFMPSDQTFGSIAHTAIYTNWKIICCAIYLCSIMARCITASTCNSLGVISAIMTNNQRNNIVCRQKKRLVCWHDQGRLTMTM